MIPWAAINLLLLAGSLIPFSRQEHYVVRGLDFPRLQLLVFAAVSLCAQLFWVGLPSIEWIMIGSMALLVAILQAIWIIPYTPLFPREVPSTGERDSQRSLRIITANVWQPNRRADDLLSYVRRFQPDVLVVLEADDWWREQIDVLHAEGYVHTLRCPLDNLYGMLLYSRLELRDAATEYLISDEVPSMRSQVVLRSGDVVSCHWIHPAPPSPTENEESTERDAELIIVGKRVAAIQGTPAVVAGDLNDVAWSATTRLFRKISGLLDPRVGRGFFSSFHAKYPGLRWPLDHVFHSGEFTLSEIRCLRSFGSDHFPLLIELQLREAETPAHEGLTASTEDREWAEEKIAAADLQPPPSSKP